MLSGESDDVRTHVLGELCVAVKAISNRLIHVMSSALIVEKNVKVVAINMTGRLTGVWWGAGGKREGLPHGKRPQEGHANVVQDLLPSVFYLPCLA